MKYNLSQTSYVGHSFPGTRDSWSFPIPEFPGIRELKMIEYTSQNCQVIFIDDILTSFQITSHGMVLLAAASACR